MTDKDTRPAPTDAQRKALEAFNAVRGKFDLAVKVLGYASEDSGRFVLSGGLIANKELFESILAFVADHEETIRSALAAPSDEERRVKSARQYEMEQTGRYFTPEYKSAPVVDGGEALDKWQPIETAPKDHSDILVYTEIATVPVVHIAFYRSAEEWEKSGQYCGWKTLEEWEGWWSYTRGSVSQEKLEGYAVPTHWMPLPTAPRPDDGGV